MPPLRGCRPGPRSLIRRAKDCTDDRLHREGTSTMHLVLAAQHELFNKLDTNAGTLAVVAGLLIALLVATLPHDRRRRAIQPFVFLVLWGIAFAIERFFDRTESVAHVAGVIATLFLFTSIGRSCFLLTIAALRGVLG